MKPLTILLSALFLSLNLNAQVIIYIETFSDTLTGNGRTAVTNKIGFLVIENEGDIFSIEAAPKSKTFQVFDVTEACSIHYLRSSSTKRQLLVAFTANSGTKADAGALVAKGTVSTMDVGTANSMDIAKSMTLSGFAVDDDGEPSLLETKGKLTFDKKRTVAANLAGNSAAIVVGGLRASLLAQGYTEIFD